MYFSTTAVEFMSEQIHTKREIIVKRLSAWPRGGRYENVEKSILYNKYYLQLSILLRNIADRASKKKCNYKVSITYKRNTTAEIGKAGFNLISSQMKSQKIRAAKYLLYGYHELCRLANSPSVTCVSFVTAHSVSIVGK
jgi:hypothetical protein